jgi:uncharacterized protein
VNVLLFGMVTAVLTSIDHAGALPPPPEQSAANCDTPSYASDMLVCADPGLLALDRKMRDLLAAGRSASAISTLQWFESQEAWFRRRSLCAFSERHVACLRAAYAERNVLLTALQEAGSGQPHPGFGAVCPGAPWGNGLVRIHAPARGSLSIKDGRGRVLVVATTIRPQDDWSPFVRFGIEGNRIRIEPSGQPSVLCQASAPG